MMRIADLCTVASAVDNGPAPLLVTVRIPRKVATTCTEMDIISRPSKKRCRDAMAHKRDSEALRNEINDLERRLAKLRKTLGLTGSDSKSTLRGIGQEQASYLAGLQSLVAQIYPSVLSPPQRNFIHLRKRMDDRQRVILGIRPVSLYEGRSLIEERCRFMDPTREHASDDWHQDDNGDMIGVHFHMMHLTGVRSVEEVFAFANTYTTVHEVSTSKSVSTMWYHEDSSKASSLEDKYHCPTCQFRIVITTPGGHALEVNSLLFAQFYPDENVGVVVSTFVDRDDFRPYSPDKRLRQQISGVLLVTPAAAGVTVHHWIYVRTLAAPHLIDSASFGAFARENEGHKAEDLLGYIQAKFEPSSHVADRVR